MTDLSAHPTQAASAWFADFQSALERQDIVAAMVLFGADSYWRDLVAFTWNICTQEGPDAIRAMLQTRLADLKAGQVVLDVGNYGYDWAAGGGQGGPGRTVPG